MEDSWRSETQNSEKKKKFEPRNVLSTGYAFCPAKAQ